MSVDKLDLLSRGVGEIIIKESLAKKLDSPKKLRIKFGIDPNKPDIHLGHMVPIRKLRAFQEMGHTAVFIIGDYTARIGDPSAKDETRKMIPQEEIKKNVAKYFEYVFQILDEKKTEIRLQSEWFSKFDLAKVLEIASKVSVAQIMEHETFKNRIQKQQPFMIHEELYPLLQGYDSVMVNADVELGGTDQKFNLLMGRQMQKAYGQDEQDIIMMNYLVGLDGKEKMSKSLGNYISINDAPEDMFGKVMSIPDSLIIQYFELCTDIKLEALAIIAQELRDGKNPRDVKAELAKLIVEIYYDSTIAIKAQEEFDKVFKHRQNPNEFRELTLPFKKYQLIDLIIKSQPDLSRSAARRLIEQGGVEIDGKKIANASEEIILDDGKIIRIGKKDFIKLNSK